jgi:hypothetical protein
VTYNIDRYLKRPKSWTFLLEKASGSNGTLQRAVKKDGIVATKVNLYSKLGWFANLDEKWTSKDLMQHLVITFNRILESPLVRNDEDADTVRKLANQLGRSASNLQAYADELHQRANTLEMDAEVSLEESEVAE